MISPKYINLFDIDNTRERFLTKRRNEVLYNESRNNLKWIFIFQNSFKI